MQSIHVLANTLPEAWEQAMEACWQQGKRFPTEYDKTGDPHSRDVTAMIHVRNPFEEPRIHRAIPAGLDDLEKYVCEVLYGVHDHWVDPEAGKWEYTYHERLRSYDVPCDNCQAKFISGPGGCRKCHNERVIRIDQIAKCEEVLNNCWFTRRAQAICWQPWKDLGIDDPSCLQRLWFRIERVDCPVCNGEGDILDKGTDHFLACENCDKRGYIARLNMNVHIRSNDLFKAWFMNAYAFTELQYLIAVNLGIDVGEYVHIADSLHLYGSYFDEIEAFFNTMQKRDFEDRVWDTDYAIPMFVEGCDALLREEDLPDEKRQIVEARKFMLNKAMS